MIWKRTVASQMNSAKTEQTKLEISEGNLVFVANGKTIIFPGHHYGYKKTISLKENKQLSKFFTCNSLDNFIKVMKNYEKNR